MSYEGTICPCGEKKSPNTLLCIGCELDYQKHPSMKAYNDRSRGLDERGHAAMTLLALARGRKKRVEV